MECMKTWKGGRMKREKKVSKIELQNSLLETLSNNDKALDYIKNQIFRTDNVLKLDPSDEVVQEQLNIEKYIEFTLNYLDKMYCDNLKKLGVKV